MTTSRQQRASQLQCSVAPGPMVGVYVRVNGAVMGYPYYERKTRRTVTAEFYYDFGGKSAHLRKVDGQEYQASGLMDALFGTRQARRIHKLIVAAAERCRHAECELWNAMASRGAHVQTKKDIKKRSRA